MHRPLFAVPVADLESGEKERAWDIPEEWLREVLADTDATPRGPAGRLEVTIGLNRREVVVRGRVRVALSMPCSRTLDPVDINVDARLFLMLHPAAPAEPRKGSKVGPAARRAARKKHEEEGEVLSAEDAADDTYDGEQVVLDPFTREFILLELPMVPLRSDLRSTETPGISPPPDEADRAPGTGKALDPRLAPLAAIARRLRDKE